VKILPLLFCSTVAFGAAPALAQSMPMNMPGMKMPVHHATAKKPVKKPARPAKPTLARHAAPSKSKAAATAGKKASPMATPDPAQPKPANDGMADMPGMSMRAQRSGTPEMPMDHSQMAQMAMPAGEHGGHDMTMRGALGPYPMQRESSGTAWQPDTWDHAGLHVMNGDWTLMAHGALNLVYDHQSGRRGDDKVFASGILMGMAQRPLGNGVVQFKAMLSPDPLMGPKGYPLLLASGETANGTDRLIDRQHPHDLFMELSASVSQNIGPKSSLFLYGGLPGEPAFGPPAFMHRESIMDSPEAPITHHWLDSTHITFGVVTGGIVLDRVKLEASRFNAREPDQHRWNIETGPLDSTSVRLSWNPTRTLSLQGSWGHFVDPEQLEPGVNQKRWSASALWADEIVPGWKAAGTLAWGRKSSHGHNDDGIAAEASLKHSAWTLFSRAEWTENRELTDVDDGSAYRVGKVSLGAIRDFRIAEHFSLGAGGLLALSFVPRGLAPAYGGQRPTGAMVFMRLKLD
jgi:hypothetical protein